jgi:hypothetical protein
MFNSNLSLLSVPTPNYTNTKEANSVANGLLVHHLDGEHYHGTQPCQQMKRGINKEGINRKGISKKETSRKGINDR